MATTGSPENSETAVLFKRFLKSETAKNFYTLCLRSTLQQIPVARDLVLQSYTAARKNGFKPEQPDETLLYSSLQKIIEDFAAKNPSIQESPLPLSFDWTRLDVKQSDNALRILKPSERLLFLYRFFLKTPSAWILKVTNLTEETLFNTFENIFKKLGAL